MAARVRKVAVVGGGITGLTAAYYLQKQSKEQGVELEVTLIEATHRLGGKVQTLRKDGFVIERGPDSFLSRKKSINRLARDLGIEDRLIRNSTGKTSIAVENHLHPLPPGSVMGVPTVFSPFLTSSLCSWSGKLRVAGDFILPQSLAEDEDQPLGRFLRRRFGNEMVENVMEPLFSGVYAGDIDKLSLHSTFPELGNTEQKQRSLIRGLRKNRTVEQMGFDTESKSLFQTFDGGLSTLIYALEKELADCKVLKNIKVMAVEKSGDQVLLNLNNGSSVLADEVVFAIPHKHAQPLFEPFGLLENVKDMPSTSIATISMAFSGEQVRDTSELNGFVVARNSDLVITACSMAHRKWPSLTPEGKKLFRTFIGRVGDEAIVDLSDTEIEKMVLADLKKSLGVEATPEFTVVSRWKHAMPQYLVGHKERIAETKKEMQQVFPMIQLAGGSYDGFALPDCVEQGMAAANRILARC
ncbi:protoporphyrinogen oxidase [Planococcus salinus]|uniref:Coproporphyrinogen III oxidase n=1 Tax=Planococcus salinus TaxID=1848460 RepID=A0A3M8P7J6_9BACL|nr:protoporphyrinogen oxidase [Planococcus salinus]RNF39401.1 protoporphyrinogen oxidase [Planococcus salinus]